MSQYSVEDASNAYDLFKKVMADIRGRAFKSKNEKLQNYKRLYNSIRTIHEDYIRIFVKLRDEIAFSNSDEKIQKAFNVFFSDRSTLAGDRTLTKMDAETYSALSEDFAEKRFLFSIVLYFYYKMDKIRYATDLNSLDVKIWEADTSTGDAGWNSASTLVGGLYSKILEKDELSALVNNIIAAVGERFLMIEKTFSEIDGNWRSSKKISKSKFSELFFTPQGKLRLSQTSNKTQGEG